MTVDPRIFRRARERGAGSQASGAGPAVADREHRQVAALRAERERLQAQTGAQIVAGMVEYAARQKPAPVYGPEDHERCHYCHGLFLKPVEYHHSEQECALLTSQIEIGACKRLADEAQKKESGPLKVGDRVEVLDGVRSVSGRQVNGGTYRIDRVFHDGDIGLNDGSIVRASDVRRV